MYVLVNNNIFLKRKLKIAFKTVDITNEMKWYIVLSTSLLRVCCYLILFSLDKRGSVCACERVWCVCVCACKYVFCLALIFHL